LKVTLTQIVTLQETRNGQGDSRGGGLKKQKKKPPAWEA